MRIVPVMLLLAAVAGLVCWQGALAAEEGEAPDGPPELPAVGEEPELDERERRLVETLSGAVLRGSFVIDGREEDGLQPERYEIGQVRKLRDDWWVFSARVRYGERDVTVPVPILVRWAGDTPVLTLDDFNIPGLGRYTTRVVIHEGRYAGTWSSRNVGGQMFGTIERGEGGDEQ